jgi:hypothetical protein
LQPTHPRTPNLQTLTAVLKSLLIENRSCSEQLIVVHREPTIQGTFPKEIVTCRLDNGREIRLFCKYASGQDHSAHGHRGGIPLEATVYRELLKPTQGSTPALYGSYSGAVAGDIWLVLEYVGESVRVNESENPAAMGLAARWIGRFHAEVQVRLQTAEASFLKAYDAEYYLGWARRALLNIRALRTHVPWMELLFERLEQVVTVLLSAPPTVIHGEYYPKNILIRDGSIYPVDWESAAIAAGEIDLASLTERWPEAVVRESVAEYQAVRWPDGAPNHFERTLWAARMYLHLRWLGDRAGIEPSAWRLGQLKIAGEHLGLV